MKREQALEMMNRYLDHDLTAEETDTLFRHLGESPEAREDFDFLKALSDKLESFPDVQPPISLVDSILPRLNEIDRLGGAAAPEAPQPEKLSEMESKRMFGEEVPKRRKASTFWRSTLGRTVGGTAVAAAVLGIFVATYEPKEMPNAEMSPSTSVSGAMDSTLVPSNEESAEESTTDTASPSIKMDEGQPQTRLAPEDSEINMNKQAQPDSTVPQNEEPSADTQIPSYDPSEKVENQDRSAADIPSSNEPQAGSTATNTPSESASNKSNKTQAPQESKETQKSNTPSSDKTTNSAKDTGKASDTSKDGKTSSGTNIQKAPVAPTTPEKGAATSQSEESNEANPVDQEDNTLSTKENETGTDTSGDDAASMDAPNPTFGITMMPSDWKSADGTYLVTYSRNTLKLLSGDRAKEISTRKVDGDVIDGVWSADGKTFTYDWVKPDGTIAQGIWNIEDVSLEQGSK
ncbi:hypothetical protein [Saccharibacillus sp. JS10]|uniref:hypothetical protein n=1 Tax=Saccharibacillus sp. JS10 TaxID=2950552 RepID=UPI0021096F91|nr:hypothetical protein [Saccharibacillus sp. JS10]MCQ4086175.1 hypothetical protein [Saccharibacillus sp. JS10]